jgi:DNA-binding transcriptional regulator YhcF (GntR family)
VTDAPVVRIDPASAVPPFDQVRRQIADYITAGVMGGGSRLPPVRQLAADLGLAPGTVARAYQELESAGLVTTRRGGGTRVAEAAVLSPQALRAALTAAAADFVAAARRWGASNDAILDSVRDELS